MSAPVFICTTDAKQIRKKAEFFVEKEFCLLFHMDEVCRPNQTYKTD